MAKTPSSSVALGRILNRSPNLVYVLNEDWTVVFCNGALAEWVGLNPDEILGRRLGYHPSQADETSGLPTAGILMGLAPPPAALEGHSLGGHVSSMTAEGRLRYRRAQFIPLGAATGEEGAMSPCVGTVAFVSPRDLTVKQLADSRVFATGGQDEDTAALHQTIRRFRHDQAERFDMDRFVGTSCAICRAREQIVLAAETIASVLVYGPPGSGRSHAARAIYYRSRARLKGPMTPLECDLLGESPLRRAIELAGSQTADGETGTLLLSNVDQLPEAAQSRLAELLAEHHARWRILATAEHDIIELARRGDFSHELACRLATIVIRLPGLAERGDDLPLLAQMFAEDANRMSDRQIAGLAPEAIDMLSLYDWPGQLDELAETIRVAHGACAGSMIGPEDLPTKLHHAADTLAFPSPTEERIELDQFLAQIERELINRALDKANGNKALAARMLGMTRPRLYRRMTQLGLLADTPGGGPSERARVTDGENQDELPVEGIDETESDEVEFEPEDES